MRTNTLLPVLVLGLALAACGGGPVDETGAEPGTTTSTSAGSDQQPDREDADRADPPAPDVPTSEPGEPVTGEVDQAVLGDILADAAEAWDVDASQLVVLRAEQVQWNDGSLGCGKPGEMYTQAIVDGAWVEIGHGDDIRDYRINQNGIWILCEGGGGPPFGGAPDS